MMKMKIKDSKISVINCSFSIFEDLTTTGALLISKNDAILFVSFAFFSHCTRSGLSGGAIHFTSENGESCILKSCFEWCFTNTPDKVDFGQTAYVSCKDTIFTQNSFIFCSTDEHTSRNGGFHVEEGNAIVEQVNASNSKCQFSAGLLFRYSNKASINDCTMINLTSTKDCDTICFFSNHEASTLRRVIYISCTNPSNGEICHSSVSLSAEKCTIIRCINFPPNRYKAEFFEVTSTSETKSLTLNKCKGNEALFKECLFSSRSKILFISFIMFQMLLVQIKL